jgi:hypothetical protein
MWRKERIRQTSSTRRRRGQTTTKAIITKTTLPQKCASTIYFSYS